MFAVPTATPVTWPVVEPTVAMLVLLLLHVPGPATSLNVAVDPIQTCGSPIIAGGVLTTVKTIEVVQPLDNV